MHAETKPQAISASVFNIQHKVWLRPKYIFAAMLAAIFLYVIWYHESFLINMKDSKWQHIESFKWVLLPHVLASVCAIVLCPFQFSDRLRVRYAKLHRILGRIYVGGVLIGATLGVYVHYFELIHLYPNDPVFLSGFIGNIFNALLWTFCTVMAMIFILQRKVQLHRQWMTRSFACALIFVETRFIAGIFHLHGFGEIILWSCVAMAVPLADLALYLEEYFRMRSKQSRAAAQIA